VRILVVHLSDIHILADDDPVLSRAERISEAINSRNEEAQSTLIVVSGDIAFSGKAEEYELARVFLRAIADGVVGKPVIAVVPGNHDCNFQADSAARRGLISLLASDSITIDDSVVDQCVAVQSHFLAFRDSLDNGELTSTHPLYYEYDLSIASKRLVVRCCNTAWVSSLHEVPGTLVYPEAALDGMSNAAFAISTFHHPYNWLIPGKAFRRIVEARSDLVLTGHEHDHDRSITLRPEIDKATSYIEGSALQVSTSHAASAFNVILVDIDSAKQRFHHFEWDGNRYQPTHAEDVWEPLPLQAFKSADVFDVEPRFREWLLDPGIPNLDKSGKSRAFLDIFLYPQLIEFFRDPTLNQKRRVISSDDVAKELLRHEQTYIAAPPKSGRTASARRLYLEYLDDGLVPVYLDAGRDSLRVGDGAPNVVLRQAERQYGTKLVEVYRQLPLTRRILIIDNVDKAKLRFEPLTTLLEQLARFASHIVVLGDDTTGAITELAPIVEDPASSRGAFEIRPFNRGLRERLAQRWFERREEAELGDAKRSQRLADVARTLDTIIGRNYVPAFPIFVIAVLQAFEDNSSIDVRASTHGYFYEVLIRLALVGGNASDFNVRFAFLTHVAFEMFESGKDEWLEAELHGSFERYQNIYAVGRLDYRRLRDALEYRGMLVMEADRVRFRYPYLYYYFVASYFRNNITDERIRRYIVDLTQNPADDRAADILMFLAHLTNDRFVIDKLLESAASFYPSTEPATLETVHGKQLAGDIALSYTEKPIEEARRERADQSDEQAEKLEQARRQDSDSASADVKAFASAVQTLRLLGQVLRNFPGTLDFPYKVLLTEASCELGLRCLTVVSAGMESEREQALKTIIDQVHRAYPNLPRDRIRVRAERFLWFATILTSFGLIRLISSSIAAPELEPAYEEVFSPSDSIATKLIDVSLKIDVSTTFPVGFIKRLADDFKDKTLPTMILKLLVLEHFEQVWVAPADRQAVCAKLGIDYRFMPLGPRRQ
jgi:predicted MPP superfamily phosphohydrolase